MSEDKNITQKFEDFTVIIKLRTQLWLNIKAISLKDAIEKGMKLKIDDIITTDGVLRDEGMQLLGIYRKEI